MYTSWARQAFSIPYNSLKVQRRIRPLNTISMTKGKDVLANNLGSIVIELISNSTIWSKSSSNGNMKAR